MYKNKITIDNKERNNIAGLKIMELRKKQGWSQNDLAIQLQNTGLDLHKNAISDIESGKRFVTDIELVKIAELFNVTTDDLFSGTKECFSTVFSHSKRKLKISKPDGDFNAAADNQ